MKAIMLTSMGSVGRVAEREVHGVQDPFDTEGGAGVSGGSFGPFGIFDYDSPETICARKYATGTHMLLEEIGGETGATPKGEVWVKNKAKLYRYQPADGGGASGERRAVPVLLIYAFVLKPYVLDLVPGNSLAEYLVGEGFDVYTLDFRVSGAEDVGLSLDDCVLDYMRGTVDKVLQTSGAEEISLFGQSLGGTLCAMYASLFPGGPLKNVVLLSAPTEFAPRHPGPLGLWTFASRNSGTFFYPAMVPRYLRNLPTYFASQVISTAATVQAAAVGMSARPFGPFGSFSPFGRVVGAYAAALRQVKEWAGRDVSMRSWLAVSKWVDDAEPFPGEAFRRWVGDFYQRESSSRAR